jgi:heme/copper-type cytochrome/quinol oxidase subunit 1
MGNLVSTHHTDVGLLYVVTSFTFFLLRGALAIRTELFLQGFKVIEDPSTFHRIFTVYGTTMLLLVIPFATGVRNYLIPILVRYKDMAWPKLSAVGFWMIPVAAAFVWLGFSDTVWTAYAPYSILSAPGPTTDIWIFGAKLRGLSSILSSINFIVTILRMKLPDLSTMHLPASMMVKKTLTDMSKSLTSSGDTNLMQEEMELMRTKEDLRIENVEITSYKMLISVCQKLEVQDAIGPLQQSLKEGQDIDQPANDF